MKDFHGIDYGGLWFVGYSTCVDGVLRAPAGSFTPIKYKYEVGGNLEIQFSARDFSLVPMVSILVLERAARKGGMGGSQVIRARVIKREHGSDRVRLMAVDALGKLGVVRLRRPCILDEAASTYTNTAIACFGGGLMVKDVCEGAAVFGDIGLPLKPGENLAGSLHRMGLCQRIWLVEDNGGAYGLTMIVPGKYVMGPVYWF